MSKHLLIRKEDGEITFSGSLDIREALKVIELKINEEEAKSMDWILGDLDTFPVQQSELEDILMSKGKSANQVKKSASAIMQWFKKPLKLEYGRGNFVGWEAQVKKSDLVFSEKLGLLKAIKSDTVSPSMFLLWESLAGLSNFSNGRVNGLLQESGLKAWSPFCKFVIEWGVVIVKYKKALIEKVRRKFRRNRWWNTWKEGILRLTLFLIQNDQRKRHCQR